MITLYSYPTLFGVADNNGYGLKVFAFLRLVSAMHHLFGKPASTLPDHAAGLPFVHEHIFDASAAPRGQLPYVIDGGETIGDSETIIAHLIGKYALTIDAALGARERDLSLLITRMLDDLYWVMSYSRWKDERYWPLLRDALMREHPSLTQEGLLKAREFNFQRYHFQGIGRFERLLTLTRAASPISRCWPASFHPAAMCMGRPQPASMPASMASSPIFSFTTSTRRSSSSSRHSRIWCAIAPPSTKQ
jgi:hypothetical protein